MVAIFHGAKVQKFVDSVCKFCPIAKTDHGDTIPSQVADHIIGAKLVGSTSRNLIVIGEDHVLV